MENKHKRYAEALFAVSKESGDVTAHQNELLLCKELYQNLPCGIFSNPLISNSQKHQVIESLLRGRVSQAIVNFMKVLCDYRCIGMIGDIYDAYYKMALEYNNILEATLYYVVLPEEDELSRIKKWLAETYKKDDILLHLEEDQSLIGGIKILVGDIVYDKSVKKMADMLRKSLKLR